MKVKLSLTAIVLSAVSAFAQTANLPQAPLDAATRGLKDMNRAEVFSTLPTQTPRLKTAAATDSTTFTPIAELDAPIWGSIDRLDANGQVIYSLEQQGNTMEINTYDDDVAVAKSFSFQIPESTNSYGLINHYSTTFFNDDNLVEFVIYLHYFDPEIPGPAGQVQGLWVVNENGEVLKKLTGSSAWAKLDANGQKHFFTYLADSQNMTVTDYDVSTWQSANSYVLPAFKINYFTGVPVQFTTIQGTEYLVVAHYEKVFMDNATLQLTPNNHLIVELLDLDFNTEKTFSLDISSAYPDSGQYVLPQASFGTFFRTNQYDISKNIFDTDAGFEIVYGVHYYDMIKDFEWDTYRVANEDGSIIHTLDEYIISSNLGLQSIDGQDNQLGFLLAEELDGQPTQLGFFDIESWTMVNIMDAFQSNGDQLSDKFNRIPFNNSYHYLIGLGAPDAENGKTYGVIAEYTKTGELHKRHRFLLPDDMVLFSPVLSISALTAGVFDEDSDSFYFLYSYLQEATVGQDSGNISNVVIADSTGQTVVEFRGDTEKGNITGGGVFLDDAYNKLAIQYGDYGTGYTEFYALPFFTTLGLDDLEKTDALALYPNPATNYFSIQSKQPVKQVVVYNIMGETVYSASASNTQERFNVSSLTSGLYIVQINFINGDTKRVKLLKK